jgi:UDP-N-acetylmuramoyl-L-alanyl-D-glutamate--2,6-diaminopimelate ligase
MEPIKLKKLLKNIPDVCVKGSKEIEISGICTHSKRVAPGNLFIAKKGLTNDGARFIPDAIAAGAVAIVTDLYDPFYPDVVQILTEDTTAIEAQLAEEYYQCASQKLFLIAITGTNGKTTTSYLIKHIFDALGSSCGLIGTVEWIVGQHVFPSSMTTPDLISNHKLFYEMVKEECRTCVMEVSSHALDQERVRAVEFDVAVFTNLTQDHLDYHKSLENYAAAKAKLFASLTQGKKPYPKWAVLNADSSYKEHMQTECSASVLTYGIDTPCDLMAQDIALFPQGLTCKVCYHDEILSLKSALIGRFNVYNLLAAIGASLVRGFSLKACINALSSFTGVSGRLERVANARNLNIFVDYAHTDDALENVLKTLKELKAKRILTVFGCGGSRDSSKRPKMGAVVERYSDLIFITSDNPRAEDPLDIIAQILTGLSSPERAYVIPDRSQAIQQAIDLCAPDDILLIAGKGHETTQIFSHTTINFDDRLCAKTHCAER